MRFIPALLAFALLLPTLAQAETLRRNYKTQLKPIAPVQLLKKFYRIDQVKGTCSYEKCEMRNVPDYKEFCEDKTEHKYVCKQNWDCTGPNGCEWKEVCGYEWVTERVCERRWVDETRQVCDTYEYSCMKDKKVLDRKWQVTVTPTFDPRAVLDKKKDEKFEITLDGDERAPKLLIKTKRSPYKYFTDYSFVNEKEAKVEFRLDEKPAE